MFSNFPSLKLHFRIIVSAALISLFLSLSLYLLFIQSPILSKREPAFTALLWLALTPLLYLLLSRFIHPRLNAFAPRTRRYWLLISAAVGILFSLVTKPPQLILLLPSHTLQIVIPASSPDRHITLEYATTALGGDISFSQFSTSGNWHRTDSGFTYSGSGPASLSWSGRTGETASLNFSDTPATSEVMVGWDGDLSPLGTSQTAKSQIPIAFTFEAGWQASAVSRLIVGFTTGFLFLTLTLFLAGLELNAPQLVKRKKGAWLLYSLPMIIIWVFFLLIFFPGITNEDLIVQWQQVASNQYTDHHPLLYTLLIGLVSRVYNSPASVVITQILMVSLALAWGFAELERMGVSRKFLWGMAALSAILPVNILTTVTLRKDVPYSVALLVLSVIFLKLINTRGAWLKIPWNWLGLGLILGVVSLTRINGLPVAFGAIVLILILYRQTWWRMAMSAGVFVLMLAIMYGPVYSLLKVKHEPEFGTILFLHHIAAHLQAGMSLSPEQEDFLVKLAPLDGWNYNCCQANPTMVAVFPGVQHVQNYDLPLLKQDIRKPTRIALDLFLKDPLVDLRHMVCASQQVWSLNSTCPDRIAITLLSLNAVNYPENSFYMQQNELGFVAESKFPGLIQFANPYLQIFSKGLFHKINYTTAIYLYLAIYCTALLAYRKKDWFVMVFLVPTLIQSMTLFLINVSQTYRYQYGVVLVGLLSIGLLFTPLEKKSSEISGMSETNSSGANQ